MPQVQIAIVEPATIVPNLIDLLGRIAAAARTPNITIITGSSKTADIEGALVRGSWPGGGAGVSGRVSLFQLHPSRDPFHHSHDAWTDRFSVMLGPDHDVDVHFKGIEQSHQLVD